MKVKFENGETYEIVVKGDTNGDGNVSITDAILLLNALKGERTLENEYNAIKEKDSETESMYQQR